MFCFEFLQQISEYLLTVLLWMCPNEWEVDQDIRRNAWKTNDKIRT